MNHFTGGRVYVPREDFIGEDMVGEGSCMAVMSVLYALAAYKPKHAKIGTKKVELQPGQLVISLIEIMRMTGFTRSVTRTTIAKLVSCHRISQQVGRHGHLITILNYNANQENKTEVDQRSSHRIATGSPTHFANDQHIDQHFDEPRYEYDEHIQENISVNDQRFDQSLIKKEGKKDNKEKTLITQNGGNSLAGARPGKSDHHLGRGVNLATEALKAAELERMEKILGGMSDSQLKDKFVAIVKEHFDPAFTETRPGRSKSKGFSFVELNETAGDLLAENDWDWMIRFGKWLQERKAANGGIPLRVSQIKFYKGIFDSGKPPGHATEMAQMYALRRGN